MDTSSAQDTQQPQDTQATAAPDGANTSGTSQESQQPYFVANTKEEYEAKFGPTRTEGRVSLAKKYGFETIEAMDNAMNAYKEHQNAQKTELQRAQEAEQTQATEATQYKSELATLKLQHAAEKQALSLGVDPAKLDAVLKLRNVADGELDESGNPNPELLKTSIAQVLEAHPYFKGAPQTVATGGTPAQAAAATTTLDEQIAEAQKAGNIEKAISLQMQKLMAPA